MVIGTHLGALIHRLPVWLAIASPLPGYVSNFPQATTIELRTLQVAVATLAVGIMVLVVGAVALIVAVRALRLSEVQTKLYNASAETIFRRGLIQRVRLRTNTALAMLGPESTPAGHQ